LVPLRGDLHVRDVRYEITEGADFDRHIALTYCSHGGSKVFRLKKRHRARPSNSRRFECAIIDTMLSNCSPLDQCSAFIGLPTKRPPFDREEVSGDQSENSLDS
jgi:hypothetical protein